MRNCGSLLEPIESAINGCSSGNALLSVRNTDASVPAMSTLS